MLVIPARLLSRVQRASWDHARLIAQPAAAGFLYHAGVTDTQFEAYAASFELERQVRGIDKKHPLMSSAAAAFSRGPAMRQVEDLYEAFPLRAVQVEVDIDRGRTYLHERVQYQLIARSAHMKRGKPITYYGGLIVNHAAAYPPVQHEKKTTADSSDARDMRLDRVQSNFSASSYAFDGAPIYDMLTRRIPGTLEALLQIAKDGLARALPTDEFHTDGELRIFSGQPSGFMASVAQSGQPHNAVILFTELILSNGIKVHVPVVVASGDFSTGTAIVLPSRAHRLEASEMHQLAALATKHCGNKLLFFASHACGPVPERAPKSLLVMAIEAETDVAMTDAMCAVLHADGPGVLTDHVLKLHSVAASWDTYVHWQQQYRARGTVQQRVEAARRMSDAVHHLMQLRSTKAALQQWSRSERTLWIDERKYLADAIAARDGLPTASQRAQLCCHARGVLGDAAASDGAPDCSSTHELRAHSHAEPRGVRDLDFWRTSDQHNWRKLTAILIRDDTAFAAANAVQCAADRAAAKLACEHARQHSLHSSRLVARAKLAAGLVQAQIEHDEAQLECVTEWCSATPFPSFWKRTAFDSSIFHRSATVDDAHACRQTIVARLNASRLAQLAAFQAVGVTESALVDALQAVCTREAESAAACSAST